VASTFWAGITLQSTEWTDADFDQLSWHDNHIHGFTIIEGQHGAGELILDIDYIVEWIKGEERIEFVISPADLVFHNVTGLRIDLDYDAISAAIGPLSIDGIHRSYEVRERYTAQVWALEVNFPAGRIQFEASGFTQRLRGPAKRSVQQVLTKEERK